MKRTLKRIGSDHRLASQLSIYREVRSEVNETRVYTGNGDHHCVVRTTWLTLYFKLSRKLPSRCKNPQVVNSSTDKHYLQSFGTGKKTELTFPLLAEGA